MYDILYENLTGPEIVSTIKPYIYTYNAVTVLGNAASTTGKRNHSRTHVTSSG